MSTMAAGQDPRDTHDGSTSRLSLICQGASPATRAAAFPDDGPLEEKTLAALRGMPAVGRHRARAWVSPMQAARQTAEALALAIDEDRDLRAPDYGRWAGRTLAAVVEDEPAMLAQWLADPQFSGHGGESLDLLLERARKWLGRRGRSSRRTIAVTNAAVVRAMVVEVLGAPVQAFWRIDIAPLTVTELRHDGRRWTLRCCGRPLEGAPVD